jgi:N-acetylneuraminate lyase
MKHLDGYLAAPFTPMHENGDVNLDLIPVYAAFLARNGLDGAFICGSTGEGALLTREERMAVAEAWMNAAGKVLKIVIHTGGTNLRDQKILAAHAERIGAWAAGAMAPAFLSPTRNEELLAFCQAVAAAAPTLPFYYYHIPGLNGVSLSVPDLLHAVKDRIPNFAGVKYTSPDKTEFAKCLEVAGGTYEMLWGEDEMFLEGLLLGNKAGIGGTYNQCFSLYRQMGKAHEQGQMELCRELQKQSRRFCAILDRYRGNMVAGKRVMKYLGLDCGPNRLPLQSLSEEEEVLLRKELEHMEFFKFCNRISTENP